MSTEGFDPTKQLASQEVKAREGIRPKIFWFTPAEYGIILLNWFVFGVIFKFPATVWLIAIVLNIIFLTQVRRRKPDNWLMNLIKFWFRRTFHYRANEPDVTAVRYFKK